MQAFIEYAASNALALVALLVGLPPFILNQLSQAAAARHARFQDINDQYLRFLEVAAQYPELRVTGNSDPLPVGAPLSDDQQARRAILFDMLTSLFERIHHAYRWARSKERRNELEGWDEVMSHFAERPDYREWWIDVAGLGDPEKADGVGSSAFLRSFEAEMIARFRGERKRSRWYSEPTAQS